MTYLLRKYDDTPPTHVMREVYLPAGEIVQWGGYVFVPPELAARLGEPDDTIAIGENTYPAWRLGAQSLEQLGD